MNKKIEYKYSEDRILSELSQYIDKTYGEHYSQSKIQSTEFIIDNGFGLPFALGNMLKYTQRYGKKGTSTDWRKDLLKVIHYGIIALHIHDKEHETVKISELLAGIKPTLPEHMDF